ncbi:MAG: glycosyl transferase family 39 [Chloroflexi bacterium]|nr:glycosyl transferase family 39 [Chloroflexota bacterium]
MRAHVAQACQYLLLGLFLLLALLSLTGPLQDSPGEANLYALQANAFLQGRLDLPQHYHDTAVFRGRYYVPFPPFPALLVTPIVALVGLHSTNMVLVSLLLALATGWVFWRILQRLDVPRATAIWLLAAFFLGTSYWGSVHMSRGVWFTAHIVSAGALLLAIDETLGRRRGLLVGLYLGCAFLSRQLTALYLPMLAALLWWRSEQAPVRRRWVRLLSLLVGAGLCGGLYLWFNWARFGNALDTGYGYLRLGGMLQERVSRYGLFSPRYVWFNLYHLLVQGFDVSFNDPAQLSGWELNGFGTSLLVASPFLLLSLRARWSRLVLALAWLGTVGIIMPTLLYYNNGWWQINAQRFTMDFVPVVMVLTALAARDGLGPYWKGAIVWSLGLNALAWVVIPMLA